jgi:quercetin dioxygenase-like cupin family protein
MEKIQSKSELDRRDVLLFGAAGAATLFGGTSFAMADEVKAQEIAPGVTLKTFKSAAPLGPVPGGYTKANLMELTFQPGAKFTDPGSKTVVVCEIQGAPLYVEIKGKEPFTLQPGDIYFCPIGNVETDTNKSDKPSIMRVVELEPAA